jgi:hypothetical protein
VEADGRPVGGYRGIVQLFGPPDLRRLRSGSTNTSVRVTRQMPMTGNASHATRKQQPAGATTQENRSGLLFLQPRVSGNRDQWGETE